MRSSELTDPGEPKCGQWSRVSDAVTITLVTLIITVERANGFINILFLLVAGGHTPGSLRRGMHQLKDALEECGRVRNSLRYWKLQIYQSRGHWC